MKLFVATREGSDRDDYSRTVEGELVRLPITCDMEDCECSRAMTGLASGESTTTFTVNEFDLDRYLYRELLWDTLLRDGWVVEDDPDDFKWVDQLVTLHLDLAESFVVGVPLQLRGDKLFERRTTR